MSNARGVRWIFGFWIAALIVTILIPYYFKSAPPNHIFAVVSFLIDLFLVAAVTGTLGVAITGSIYGILLTPTNRYSLARLQMVLWTIFVLAMLFTAAKLNIVGYFGSSAGPLKLTIPGELLAAMGIAAFTTVATPSILTLKASQDSSTDEAAAAQSRQAKITGEDAAKISHAGKVVSRTSHENATWLDCILGDEVANAGVVDLTKVQQLLITILLVGTYALSFIAGLTGNDPTMIPDGKGSIVSLPTIGADLITLMAISHGGYLAYKAAPKTSAPAPTQDGGNGADQSGSAKQDGQRSTAGDGDPASAESKAG